ncbi:MAG: DNA cytosine methyltransferase [Nostocaceae cyanobacterium]|nr:DNA cytosine methyltransferase [Nostocaceae cyanobacterium]
MQFKVAIDNNPKVLATYQINFPNTTVFCKDIKDITAAEIREILQNKYQNWDGEIAAVIGGPPCQGFSVAGKQDVNDERSQLVIKFINLVVELNPSMFVMENVAAIEYKKFSQITGNAWSLAEEHYILSKWLLTASDYGVPQKRQRAIWVGSKFGEVAIPFEISRNGRAEPYRVWKDKVHLAQGETVHCRLCFADFTGKTVYHCHILDHEDLGMMGILDIRG